MHTERDFYQQTYQSGKLIAPNTVAAFVAWVMLKTNAQDFSSRFWNIYDEPEQTHWLPQGWTKPILPA